MTPPQKPEWMELADADSAPAIKKSTRLIPAFIAAAAIAIVGVGAVATQISDQPPASASEISTPTQSILPSAPNESVKPTTTSPKMANPNSISPAQPNIASLPKGGGDDDGEDDEYEGDDD